MIWALYLSTLIYFFRGLDTMVSIHISLQVRVAAGRVDSIKRSARRTKRAGAPKEPESRPSIPHPLPDAYQTTGGNDNMPFVLYDNGSSDNRIIVFGTDAGLNLLAENDTWYMDGTFGTSPPQFEQLFVIRVHVGEIPVSAVYALLPSKCQSVYEECLNGLLDACLLRDIRPTPSTVIMDFELAIHNAVKTMLGDVDIKGCFYHLTQSTWRRVQAEGLATEYRENDELKQFVGMIDGLAFLPVDEVVEGMTALKDLAPDSVMPVIDYFDNTYVSGGYKSVRGPNGIIRMRRTPPRFPPPTWNVHETTLNGGDRTNNNCESWNNSFRHLVGHSNPSLWTVLSCLQKDQTAVNTEMERQRTGQPSAKRAKKTSVSLQKRLNKLCRQYRDGAKTTASFLFAIGECIRL